MTAAVAATVMVTSCSSNKEINYFQDLKAGSTAPIATISPIRFQPNDKVSIIVSTTDGRLNTLFNLAVPQNSLGGTNTSSAAQTTGADRVAPYTIDRAGNINFPVLGKLHIAGMTREELAEYIRRELISRDLAKNPIVTVEYLNLNVTVLGEVAGPGRYGIDREDYTILDALSSAGDLTIYGKRDNIRVIREENGVQHVYQVDLGNGRELAQSPVYYLKQNDVIYVEPNATKARTSTPNGNSALTPTFWFGVVTFAVSMGTLIYTICK